MARMGKYLSLCLVAILAVTSLLMIKPIDAQTITKPSVPEFSLDYTEHHYGTPSKTTSTIDPYTGKTTTTTVPGQYTEWHTLYIIIKNQPFVPFQDSNKNIDLYFNVSYKGHFENEWHDYPPYNGSSQEAWNYNGWFYEQKDSQDTIIFFNLLPKEGKVDFRVEAHTGYYKVNQIYPPNDPRPYYTYEFIGQSSGWSSTQTLDVISGSISIPVSTTSPISTPTVPEFPITASLVAVLAAVTLLLVLGKRKLTVTNH
jgi:hypothetical protein